MTDFEVHAEEMVGAMLERHEGELRDYQARLLQQQSRPKYSRELLDLRRIQEHLAKAKDYAEAHKMKLKSDALEAWELEKWRNKRQQEMFQREQKSKYSQGQPITCSVLRQLAYELYALLLHQKSLLSASITLFVLSNSMRSSCVANSFVCVCCNTITQFKAGKATEMQALLKRVQTGREEQKKQRQTDLERLLQRYQNVKMELEAQQNLERTRADRTGRLPRHRASSGR
eukprot:10952-Heterococcus_DN1.PRE.3